MNLQMCKNLILIIFHGTRIQTHFHIFIKTYLRLSRLQHHFILRPNICMARTALPVRSASKGSGLSVLIQSSSVADPRISSFSESGSVTDSASALTSAASTCPRTLNHPLSSAFSSSSSTMLSSGNDRFDGGFSLTSTVPSFSPVSPTAVQLY